MDFISNALHSIGFNYHVALANFVNFLIVLFVLNKFVFKKVVQVIKDREEMIKKGLTNASEAEKILGDAKNESERLISEAKLSASQALEDTINEANSEASNIRSAAENEISNLRTDLKNKISNAEERVESEFKKNAPDLARALLSRILNESIDENMNNKISLALTK